MLTLKPEPTLPGLEAKGTAGRAPGSTRRCLANLSQLPEQELHVSIASLVGPAGDCLYTLDTKRQRMNRDCLGARDPTFLIPMLSV